MFSGLVEAPWSYTRDTRRQTAEQGTHTEKIVTPLVYAPTHAMNPSRFTSSPIRGGPLPQVIMQWPLLPILLPAYGLAAMLTIPAPELLVNVAWDSAGVTTGPVTVPLVISLGLGVGTGIGAADGFGILSLASVCPIISVLAVGLLLGGSGGGGGQRRQYQLVPMTERAHVSDDEGHRTTLKDGLDDEAEDEDLA